MIHPGADWTMAQSMLLHNSFHHRLVQPTPHCVANIINDHNFNIKPCFQRFSHVHQHRIMGEEVKQDKKVCEKKSNDDQEMGSN